MKHIGGSRSGQGQSYVWHGPESDHASIVPVIATGATLAGHRRGVTFLV